jgi:hypothetical protein
MRRRGLVIAAVALLLVARCGNNPFEGCPQNVDSFTSCNNEGLRCTPSNETDACKAAGAFVCTKGTFVFQVDAKGTCSDSTLVCPLPGTECGTCTCDGHAFHCAENCCVCGNDSGPPTCPAPVVVSEGGACQSDLRCASLDHCDGGASAACACSGGTWTCSCIATPTVIASNAGGSAGIATDATYVYWTAFNAGMVNRALQVGGPLETLAASQTSPDAITLDSANVYWTNTTNPNGSVMTLAKAGDAGAPVSLASNLEFPESVAVDGTNVYWGMFNGVQKALLDAGAPMTLVAAQGHVNALAVDAANVYAATDYGVVVVPIGGGASVTLSPDPAQAVAVDSTNVYWASSNNVIQFTLATKVTTVIAPVEAAGMAVDGALIYWTEPIHGAVMKAPIGGGKLVVLALGEVAPKEIAVGTSNVFWTSGDDSVKSAPK